MPQPDTRTIAVTARSRSRFARFKVRRPGTPASRPRRGTQPGALAWQPLSRVAYTPALAIELLIGTAELPGSKRALMTVLVEYRRALRDLATSAPADRPARPDPRQTPPRIHRSRPDRVAAHDSASPIRDLAQHLSQTVDLPDLNPTSRHTMTYDFLSERLAELIRINDYLNARLGEITRDYAQGGRSSPSRPAPNGPRSTAPPAATTSASSPPATSALPPRPGRTAPPRRTPAAARRRPGARPPWTGRTQAGQRRPCVCDSAPLTGRGKPRTTFPGSPQVSLTPPSLPFVRTPGAALLRGAAKTVPTAPLANSRG